jgi:hypothetical protein
MVVESVEVGVKVGAWVLLGVLVLALGYIALTTSQEFVNEFAFWQ